MKIDPGKYISELKCLIAIGIKLSDTRAQKYYFEVYEKHKNSV